ncbi:MAG TPA: YdcF family protein, partial [Cyclobacteriaceae bacterium]|nr:YdcF family protein [Cyclobacteriaceae bacterium]
VMRAWEIKPVTLEEMKYKQYRVGIVLTGVTAIEPELDDRVFFARGADRVAHAVQLYKLGVIQKILISGGTGKLLNPEEGEAMKLLQAFIYMGVPEWAILIESESRNTHESALASKEIIEGTFKPEDCLLITSAFHMRRARACFHKIGWPIDTYSVDVYSSRTNYNFDTLFIPKIDALIRWHKLSKECTGMLAYKIAGYI